MDSPSKDFSFKNVVSLDNCISKYFLDNGR